MAFIKPFREIGKDDAGIAGGKGASLGEMTQAGIPVPPGFVVLADTFEQFIEATDLNIEIDAVLDTVKHEEMHTVEHASEKIQALILAAAMPSDITSDIQKNFKELGAEFVAVRSSATAEDSASAAWAGQLDTYLNTTEAELLLNVQRCWASLFTPRAIFYRFEKGLHNTKISVAVVVQKMVQSDASGIAFSVHPVTEDHNQLIIEASWGLGEAIVSGQVTPDSYVVTKEPREIIDKNIAEKTRGLYRKVEGGNDWQDVPKEKQEIQTLSDAQISELATIVVGIENHYGFPCDIEWAMEADAFYITQSRPITTLSENFNGTSSSEEDGETGVLKKIKNHTWYQDWSGLYSQVEASLDADAYFGDFERELSISFSEAFVTFVGETAIGWLRTDEAEKIGTYLVEKLQDASFRATYCKKFKDYHDEIRAFIELPQETFLERFRSYRELYPKLAPYTIGTKLAFNVLPLGHEDLAADLEELRKYTERIYKDTATVINALCRTIAKKHGYAAQTALTLTAEEIAVYGESGALPSEETLTARTATGGIYFIPGSAMAVTKAETEEIIASFKSGKMQGNELVGIPAHSGVVRGICRIVFDFREAHLNNGDILVTPMTNPNFVPIMQKAVAIVTDGGGLLSHAAIVARELGKPCITGTTIATQVLKDGDMIEVDADNGVVRKL